MSDRLAIVYLPRRDRVRVGWDPGSTTRKPGDDGIIATPACGLHIAAVGFWNRLDVHVGDYNER